MLVLVDTNVLIRTLQPQSPLCRIASSAVQVLARREGRLCVVPQNLFELWVVATRPVAQNGFGLSIPEASAELNRIKDFFEFLPDNARIYSVWERLVSDYGVSGKPAHDARLAAAMEVHGIDAILTFDAPGFSRFAHVRVVNPKDVIESEGQDVRAL